MTLASGIEVALEKLTLPSSINRDPGEAGGGIRQFPTSRFTNRWLLALVCSRVFLLAKRTVGYDWGRSL